MLLKGSGNGTVVHSYCSGEDVSRLVMLAENDGVCMVLRFEWTEIGVARLIG